VSLTVLIVIGIGVGVVGGLQPLGTVQGRLVPETTGAFVIGHASGTIGVVHALQGSHLVASSSIQSTDYTFQDSAEFSLRLPPGRYKLDGTLASFGCATADVEVRANATASVSIECPLTFGDAG
jgi:hypothetical protein